jgi:hypothetical protein|nr:methyltransferase [uncultured Capnocytophaga sp.]
MYKTLPKKRYQKTLSILKRYAPQGSTILDIGVENPFSTIMKEEGYTVLNTTGQDLDFEANTLQDFQADFTTALEILEHLVNPLAVLQNVPTNKILITVPLRLWFAKAYRNTADPRDCHYHEFEDWQLDMLVEKAGFRIVYREKWTHPVKKLGLRPLLRYFTNRYYAVVAERINKLEN